jgi:hypothetical protein
MSNEAGRAMKSFMLAEKLDSLALVQVLDSPEKFAAKLRKQRRVRSEFIRQAGIEQVQ